MRKISLKLRRAHTVVDCFYYTSDDFRFPKTVDNHPPSCSDVSSFLSGGSLADGPFNIDSKSGIITLVGSLSKSQVSYRLNITAKDNGRCCGGSTSRSSKGVVVIAIKDINNNAPRFPDCANYFPTVLEKENVGTFVIQVGKNRSIIKLNCRSMI